MLNKPFNDFKLHLVNNLTKCIFLNPMLHTVNLTVLIQYLFTQLTCQLLPKSILAKNQVQAQWKIKK